jgi:cytochrome c556
MTTTRIKFLIGAAVLGGAMTIAAGAQAYWGGPWGDPWSEPGWGGGPWSEPGWGGSPWSEPGWGGSPWSEPGWGGGPWSEPGWGGGPWSDYPFSGYGRTLDQMHERRDEMHDHKAAMQDVARMLSGRRTFDRAKAIGLARQIEASAGENLTRLFEPGGRRMGPFSRARIGDMESFKANAEALKLAAGELADALEKQPSPEDISAGRAWSPDWSMRGPYSRWRSEGEAVPQEVFEAYTKLRATCHGCHANFRSTWR